MQNAIQLLKRQFAISIALTLILFGLAGVICASEVGPDHFPPDAAALYQRSTQVSAPPGMEVVVLDFEETLIFDGNGKIHRSFYLLYKAITKMGAEDWSSVSVRWEPWREDRPVLRARVVTPDFQIHDLDANTVTDAPAKETQDSTYSDTRIVRAPLPAMGPGSLVEEEYDTVEDGSFLGGGMAERIYFGARMPIHHTRLVLDAPSTLPLRYDLRLLPDLKPEKTQAQGRVRITFDQGPTDAIDETETHLPSNVPGQSSLTFSIGASWQSTAQSYGSLIDKQIADANLKPVVGKLIAGKHSREDKIAAILYGLNREVRYTGIEFGQSALVPHPPEETLSHKYGDCKDKAALLVAMLRSAKMPAYIALLNAANWEDISPALPGLNMFNHAIVYVPGNQEYWIDVTDEYARLGELPLMDQERQVLVVSPETTALRLTPATASAQNVVLENREIDLSENGPARVIETSHPQGSYESSFRRSYADKENKSTKDDLTNYMKSEYLAERLDRIDRSDPADLSKPFELVLASDHAKRGATDFAAASAAIRYDGLFYRIPAELRQRKKEKTKAEREDSQKPEKQRISDYELPAAFVAEWHYTIVPPPGFRPKPLPANQQRHLGPCILTEEYSAEEGGVVHAILKFDSVKRRMTVAEATSMRDGIAEILDGAPVMIYFESIGQALASKGDIRGALKAYRELIALHPQEAIHYLQLAQCLLEAGLGESARAEARAAVKLEPGSALAQKTLALILENDLVGRGWRHGSDYASAEAAFRAAIQLDPDDKTTVADLAILLEYNSWGARYGPGARLQEAVAQYRKLSPDEIASFDIKNNLSFALFYAGDFAEAGRVAEATNPQPLNLIVACEAALYGSPSAVAAAKKLSSDDDQFKQTANGAGELLAGMRKYDLAADLKEIGAAGDNASETEAYAALYRRTQPYEQMKFANDPAGTALHFELLTQLVDLTTEQLNSISSRNGRAYLTLPTVFQSLVKESKNALTRDSRSGQNFEMGVDLSLARAQPKVQGDDAIGYKVTLYASASYKTAIYIVKEVGQYKVLGTSEYVPGVGLEILDRLSSHDLTGARALLDWLREDVHLQGGDDPLEGWPFPRFWTRGKDPNPVAMERAAAALLAEYKETAARGVEILSAAAKTPGLGDMEKANIQLGLDWGYAGLGNYEGQLAANGELGRQFPESSHSFHNQVICLSVLGKFDEADRLIEDRFKRIPDDLDAESAQALSLEFRGDFARAHELNQKIIDEGKADPRHLNTSAWESLFTASVQPADIENALKSVQLQDSNAYALHTLACLYIETGKTKQARDILLQAMDTLNMDEPEPDYWYAFGRLAEGYGEREVAIADYLKVSKPERAAAIPNSCYRLAQIHLKALQEDK